MMFARLEYIPVTFDLFAQIIWVIFALLDKSCAELLNLYKPEILILKTLKKILK